VVSTAPRLIASLTFLTSGKFLRITPLAVRPQLSKTTHTYRGRHFADDMAKAVFGAVAAADFQRWSPLWHSNSFGRTAEK
jgi:hypothetical protein